MEEKKLELLSSTRREARRDASMEKQIQKLMEEEYEHQKARNGAYLLLVEKTS